MKISESDLVSKFAEFLQQGKFVSEASHFDGDNKDRADIELHLVQEKWPKDFPGCLIIEAKSHHSTDAPNTINKIFGQLLKETGKSRSLRAERNHAFAILFPAEAGEWIDKKKKNIKMPEGVAYYREGFSRIFPDTYKAFGTLVNAKYVLAFSQTKAELEVYEWAGFPAGGKPILSLTLRSSGPTVI